ncbi:MAG: hypothetical protein LAO20_08425 [Acidobacteriia bacterium]|nr:hypothetical protein [Terriglobia bacterium]
MTSFACKRAKFAFLPGLFLLLAIGMFGQDEGSNPALNPNPSQDQALEQPHGFKAVPVLTGSGAYFTRVTAGQVQDAPSLSPLLLIPIGENFLIEAKGALSDTYAKNALGDFNGTVTYGVAYAQMHYITKYVTMTAGRFTTPFGIYGERLAPNWIRALQGTPVISPVTSGASLGGMLRGGIPVGTDKVNFNYAFYFSSNNTNHILATDRSSGGRIGFFLPNQRLEFGASFQQVLQADRPHSAGVHFIWQPSRVPLSLRSEYVRQSGTKGSGYWIESVYRLSQIPNMKRVELVARGQQFFAAANLPAATIKKLGALGLDTKVADFGMNYYFSSDVRASASYGRQFILGKNANLWTIGMTYRFVTPMWPGGGAM